MKSDERSISAIAAQAYNAEADKRTLQKKLAASERRVQDLEKRLIDLQTASDEKVRNLTDQLSKEMAKVSEMMQQLVSYMMGKSVLPVSYLSFRAPRIVSAMSRNTSMTISTVCWLLPRKNWSAVCPINGWNQSRFPWYIKESTSNARLCRLFPKGLKNS